MLDEELDCICPAAAATPVVDSDPDARRAAAPPRPSAEPSVHRIGRRGTIGRSVVRTVSANRQWFRHTRRVEETEGEVAPRDVGTLSITCGMSLKFLQWRNERALNVCFTQSVHDRPHRNKMSFWRTKERRTAAGENNHSSGASRSRVRAVHEPAIILLPPSNALALSGTECYDRLAC